MRNRTKIFIDELTTTRRNKILAIEVFGSREGENDLEISDIDFLIVCRRKADASLVFQSALQLQEKIFETKITKINRFVQKFFLGSNSYKGIHLIVLGRDELDDNFQPLSFRLKLMMKLISRNLFLYEIKQNHNLLFGQDFINKIKIEQPNFGEKLACFVFPSIVLLSILPTIVFSKRTFKIWCFKAVKYHNTSLRAYTSIIKQNYPFDLSLFNTAKFFRYKPDEYLGNTFGLYLRVWKNILGNLPFLFGKSAIK